MIRVFSRTAPEYESATQWRLMWLKFKRHRLAIGGSVVLALFYGMGLFCEFLSPHGPFERFTEYLYAQPQRLHFVDADGRFHARPFVYGITRTVDMTSLRRLYSEDRTVRYPVRLFPRRHSYRFWGLFETDLHLFGVDRPGVIFLFGTDKLGRDLFSRLLYASRISLSVGLIGVAMSFVLGCILGGVSGYFGGTTDLLIQRLIEFLISIPTIPLWMALSASLPHHWTPLRVYFFITLILSIVAWSGLARVVRGKVISTRSEDFVTAARLAGMRNGTIIVRHLLPSFVSYLIVSLTISIPNMILGRDRAELPRAGPAAAGAELGGAAQGGAERAHGGGQPVAADPRPVRGGGGDRLQLRGRRAARCRRPLQVGAAGCRRSWSASTSAPR